MKNFSELTPEELNRMNKKSLILIIGSLQEQLTTISNQLNFLTEQIALMNQRRFGRKTERADQISNQLTLFDYETETFNEPEVLSDDSPEPDITEVIVSSYTRKNKTTREEKLEGLPARIIDHELTEEELAEKFPNGYKELPPEIYKRLSIIPQTFIVDEHHVHVYASADNDGTMAKGKRPPDVFRNCIATPALLATIITGKYASHLPLERQVKAFKESGADLETNTVANWMIKTSDVYLSIMFDVFHEQLKDANVIHADETPFEVIMDGRKAGAESRMWVYRNGKCDSDKPIVLFDYQPTRRTDHPKEFLKGYSGFLVTDGYQVYHTLEKQQKGLKVAGCWVHAKRKFADIFKACGDNGIDGTIAIEATKRISDICHRDNKFDDLTRVQRKKQRQSALKPKVDDFFAWAKSVINDLPSGCETAKALQYCINQEKFLRVFLTNGDVPMDNNLAEQAIRPFTLGRKNWVNMFSTKGAHASAVLYSIVETAKANKLRVRDYIEFLIDELVKHADDTDREFIEDLLPWSIHVQSKFKSYK